MKCPKYVNSKPKCQKYGGFHKIENCGLRCSFCNGIGHTKERCWKKNLKIRVVVANFLEVLVNDEKTTLAQLNYICESNNDVFSHVKLPKHRVFQNVIENQGGANFMGGLREANIGLKRGLL